LAFHWADAVVNCSRYTRTRSDVFLMLKMVNCGWN
jgi:hypothetical protein